MAIEVSHCGSGCVLGDVIYEIAIFWLTLTIAGATLGAEYVGDYILALVSGIIFQYVIIGFATSWPANAWLVNRGIKVPM